LGHAIAARILGLKNIRILIGSGRPIISFDLFSFKWLINSFPFGGLTLFDQPTIMRAKLLAVVIAGPAVSLAFILWILLTQNPPQTLPSYHTVAGAFFWANALVLVINLVPYYFHCPHGRFANDGQLILLLTFRFQTRPTKTPKRKSNNITTKVLRWMIVIILWFAAALLVMLGYFAAMVGPKDWGLLHRFFFGGFFLTLAVLLVAMTRRMLNDPFAGPSDRARVTTEIAGQAVQELLSRSALAQNPADLKALVSLSQYGAAEAFYAFLDEKLQTAPMDPGYLYFKAERLVKDQRPGEATELLRQIPLEHLSDLGRWLIVVLMNRVLYWQDHWESSERNCEEYLASTAPDECKIAMVDQFVSECLQSAQ
jgi:hypothetical protein